MAGTEGPPIVEVEPDSYGGDRLKTLADGGLSFLWDVVVWAGGVLKVKSDADPLDCPTLKEQSNAARIGTVAAVECTAPVQG